MRRSSTIVFGSVIRSALLALFVAGVAHFAATGGLAQSGGLGPGKPVEGGVKAAAADPIAAVGHGALFGADGKVIKPTPEFRRRALDYYLNRLIGEAPASLRAEYQSVKTQLETAGKELGIDAVLVQSLTIDWLIDNIKPEDEAYLKAKNWTLRLGHVEEIAADRPAWKPLDQQFAVPQSILDFLLDRGIFIKASTTASGADYIAECRKAGVPIPPTWSTTSGSWFHEGDLTTNFLGSGSPASVYTAESTSPDGICVALPRISGSNIGLLGIICLGRETNNVCFFDRVNTPVGAEIPITDFMGGAALGGTGICSDCHAGENPYVVHPGSPLDMGSRIMGTAWYTPLVLPTWPQNPGPSILPEIVPLPSASDLRCTSCHTPSYAGRFPEVGALSSYCTAVLSNAIAQTMPPGSPGNPAYAAHADAIRAFCNQKPPGGEEVPGGGFNQDPEHVSPPIVLGPLYACAEAIEVRGSIRHALLTVFINGAAQPQVSAVNPDQQLISVPALVAGDEVYVTQIVDGLESDKSNTETVRDHTVDFPMGLPKPEIDPTVIYECGNVIAVRHLRGAQVTVYTNGAAPVTYSSGGDWTNIPPAGAPFALNDKFQAEYRMCADLSPKSDEESAGTPPASPPTPAFDPPTLYQGQELVTVTNLLNGALTRVAEASGAGSVTFSTAVDWMPNIDIEAAIGGPLAAGQSLTIESRLCTSVPRVKTGDAQSCEGIPAPTIQQPFVGQTTVTVTNAIPGARILIYDQALDEIGDGSGGLIPLSRPIAVGDILTVLQRVGQCTSANGYQVAALCTSTKQGC